MRIGIDLDGVLCFFDEAYQRELNRIQGTNVPFYEAQSWHHEERQGGFTRDTVEQFWNTTARGAKFWETLAPYYPKGSPEHTGLVQLMGENDVYFVTKRMQPPKYASETWLWNYLREHTTVPPTVLISGDKGYVARGLGLDIMVDDKPENLEQVAQISHKTERLLVDQPWNRGYKDPAGKMVKRVYGFGGVLDFVQKRGYNG